MSKKFLLGLPLVLLLTLGACTTREDAEHSPGDWFEKSQHRITDICIKADHQGDVDDFTNILKKAGFNDAPRCSKLVESDVVVSITRWGMGDELKIHVVIVQQEDADQRTVIDLVSRGKQLHGENDDKTAHRLIMHDYKLYAAKIAAVEW